MRYYEILERRARLPDRPRRRVWLRLGQPVAIGRTTLTLERDRLDDDTCELAFVAAAGRFARRARFGALTYADTCDVILVPRVVGYGTDGLPACVLMEAIGVGASPQWPVPVLEVAA